MITGNFIRSDRSMNPYYMVKEEYPFGCSSAEKEEEEGLMMMPPPRPMERLQETGPAPFLTKTYEMVDDPNTNEVVFWSSGGGSFVVCDLRAFSTALLPRYFKHSNFSCFVRQLNTYGFRKIDPDRWEFANGGFLRGQRHLLKSIKRRKTPSQPLPPPPHVLGPCVEVGRFGIDGEFERLMCDKQVLMIELVKLRQQQQNTRAYLQAMEQRLRGTEKKQQQMMLFLAGAMRNPAFLRQLVQQKEKRKELEEAMTKKRTKPIDQGPSDKMSPIKVEHLEYGDCGFGISELEALALEMQGYGRTRREQEGQQEIIEPPESDDRDLDEGFWEDLLNDRFKGELGDAEDVTVLADHFGYLDSSINKVIYI